MPSGDCLMKSRMDKSSLVVFGRSPSSINTRFADCTLPRRGSADIVTLRCLHESSTTIIVSHAT